MRSRRSRSCVVLIALAGFALAVGAQAPEPQGPTIEQAEQQVRAVRASLKDPASRPETWGVLMMSEMVLLNLRAQKAAGGAPVDPAALAAEQRKIRDRVFAEWKAARPDDATPYLSEMQGTVPPERMDDAVLALLPRFPDDPRLLNRVTQILCRREQAKAATDLVEAALERHPDRAEFYGVALSLYRTVDNDARRRELVAAWNERLPGDPNALAAFLEEPAATRDPKDSADRVERFVAAAGADASRVDRCGWLLGADQGAYRAAAVRCLAAISDRTKDPQLQARAAGFLAGAGEGGVERTLGDLPRARRLEAILNAIHALGDGECERKVALLSLLPWDGGEAAGTPSNRLGALRGCETYGPARAAFLDAVARGPADDLRNLLYRWFPKVNGHFQEDADFGLAPRVVAALEERRQREAAKAEVWLALDEAYQLAGWDDRRAAHLAAWTSSSLAPPPADAVTWLADFRDAHDGVQAGVDTLRLAWRRTHDTAVAAALADRLMRAGRMDDFAALVEELSDASPADATDTQAANLAHLLRARGALLHRDPEGALAHYGAYVDHVPYLRREEAAEYLLVVGGVRGSAAAEQAAQALCAKNSMPSAGATPSQCAANLLSEVGHAQGALQLLEAAAQRAPDDLRLQSSFAMAAEQAGAFDRAEQAYRRMLTVDPKSETYWSGLGRMAERRGDPGEMEAILRQAEQARGDQPPGLVLAAARVYLSHQQPERAIDLLTALRRRFPDAYLGEDELRQAYRDLSAATPRKQSFYVSPRAPFGTYAFASMRLAAPAGGGGVQPPSAEDLRAMHEAEAASLGIGGPMDEPKARAIVKRLAAQGNAYANIRLSIWQHAGTQGYTQDARQAAATAQPYLPALRAAAEAGEPYAEYLWGTVLLRGIGSPKQAAEGGAWLRKAAERNEPWALNNLGWMAENGDGAKLDLQEALRWYRRGAEAGNVHSMMSMATLRLAGKPALHQGAEGAQWLAKAAEIGLPEAVSWYGPLLLYGNADVPAHPERARPWLEKAAAAGDPRGLTALGVSLVSGLGGPVDEKRGIALLQQGADKRNTVAMWQLVWQLALGQGVPRDGVRAEQWIERAALAGNDDPSSLLGASQEAEPEAAKRYFARGLSALEQQAAKGDAFAGGLASRFYQMGIGVKHDPARALALARPAAAAGSTEAMRVLGWAYRLGEGVEADASQAAAWWRRGAEGGNSYCMMWYSQMLFKGQGGRQDSKTAMAWLERSGEKGNSWAIDDLGNFYDAGAYGIPRDEKKAAYWKRKALGFGNEEARGWLIAHHLLE
jgi:hypothetical protein